MAEIKVGQQWRNLRGYYWPTHLQEGDITTVTKIEFEGRRIWFNPSPYDVDGFGGHTHMEAFLDRFELVEELEPVADAISPSVYQFPNGVEVRDISAHLTSFGGQAVQYIARSTRLDGIVKGKPVEDLKKAIQLLEWEIERLEA